MPGRVRGAANRVRAASALHHPAGQGLARHGLGR